FLLAGAFALHQPGRVLVGGGVIFTPIRRAFDGVEFAAVGQQRRRHGLGVERFGLFEAAEHLAVGDVGDGSVGVRRVAVLGLEQLGEFRRALGDCLILEAGQVVIEVVHGV